MATHYTDLVTTSTELAHERGSGLIGGGAIRLIRSTYTTTTGTDETSGDTIEIANIPVGAVVLPHLSWFYHEAVAATAWNMSIGDSTDVDRYAKSIDLAATSGVRPFIVIDYDSTLGGEVSAWPDGVFTPHTATEATRTIIATLGTITGPTASKKIVFAIAYHAQV
ncbi:MAG: hypothetical protein ACO3LT_08195 [Ilumatobacteraceae bacterium]